MIITCHFRQKEYPWRAVNQRLISMKEKMTLSITPSCLIEFPRVNNRHIDGQECRLHR